MMKPLLLAHVVVSVCVLAPRAGLAQPANAPAPAAVQPQPEAQPGMGLVDAVAISLAQDPNIQLRSVDADLQAGLAQQAAGQFDAVLRGGGSFQHHQEELRDSVKEREQETRDNLDRAIPIVTAKRDAYARALSNLNNPRAVTDPRNVDLTDGITDPDIQDDLALVQAQLILMNDLIARTVDPTVRQDLIALRDEALDRSRRRFGAAYEAIQGEPERLRQLREDLGTTPEAQWSRRINVNTRLDKQLRSGLFLSPFVDFTHTAANYVGKDSTDPAKGGLGVQPLYKGEVGFDIVLPLLRGRGADDIAAVERAAGLDTQASQLLVAHEKSITALATTQAYWALRAAAERVEVLERSVELQGELLHLTRELIKAREAARVDEARVLASFSDSQANLDAAKRTLTEARVDLARTMGLTVNDVAMAPLAAEPFPQPPPGLREDETALAGIATAAVAQRPDVDAALKSEEAGKVLVRGAELESRAIFDLSGRVWGTTIGEDSPALDKWTFRSGRVALDYELPFGNNLQLGRLAQRQAGLTQSTIQARDLARTIRLNVVRLGRSLAVAAERVRSANEAVRYYDQTIDDERAKLRAGESTLIDTILTEQQTTSARLSGIAARQQYATLLAQLRYEAGLILEHSGGQGRVSSETLTAVPPVLVSASGEQK